MNNPESKRRRRGFTLLELLIVIAIIGALATMGIVSYPLIINYARKARTQATIKALEAALMLYKSQYGLYPNDETPERVMNDLTGYKTSPDTRDPIYSKDPEWTGPYYSPDAKEFEGGLRNKALLDPWMRKFQFNLSKPVHSPDKFDIWSLGPDGKDNNGEGDDVSSWR